MEREIRCFTIPMEIETREESKQITLKGYAAIFNKDFVASWFTERIAPGAFKNALKKSDVRALFNHDSSILPLGRTSAGTLRLKEDTKGLYMETDLPDTQFAKDLAESIRRGDISGQSFSFTIKSQKWDDLDKDMSIRTILEFDEIYDVGPVTYPAYTDTTIAIRSLEAARAEAQTAPPAVVMPTLTETILINISGQAFDFSGPDRFARSIEKLMEQEKQSKKPGWAETWERIDKILGGK